MAIVDFISFCSLFRRGSSQSAFLDFCFAFFLLLTYLFCSSSCFLAYFPFCLLHAFLLSAN